MIKIIILIFALTNISSCSFQSSQYNFIKGLISKDDNSKEPKKTWRLSWNDMQTDLYAINIADQIIFANYSINIFYKNHQIYKVTGLLNDNEIMEIDSSATKLIYKLDGKQISSDSCNIRQMHRGENHYKTYRHICLDQQTGDSYENQFILNTNDLIVSMKYKIHPNYPLLELNLK